MNIVVVTTRQNSSVLKTKVRVAPLTGPSWCLRPCWPGWRGRRRTGSSLGGRWGRGRRGDRACPADRWRLSPQWDLLLQFQVDQFVRVVPAAQVVPPVLLRADLCRPRSLCHPSGQTVLGVQAFLATLGIPSGPARRQSPGRRWVPEVLACRGGPCTPCRACREDPADRQSALTTCPSRLRRISLASLPRCTHDQVCPLFQALLASPALLADPACRVLLGDRAAHSFLALLLDHARQTPLSPRGVQSFPWDLACPELRESRDLWSPMAAAP